MTQLNLVSDTPKKRKSGPRPKADSNQHLKDLEAIGYSIVEIANSFGLNPRTVQNYLDGSEPCPPWTIPASAQLKAEKTGKARMILIAPTHKDDETFIKDLLKRSGIQYKELEL